MRRRFRAGVVGAGLCAALLTSACGSLFGQDADEHGAQGQPEQAPAQEQEQEPADSFTVLGTGDVLIHPELTEQAARDAQQTGRGAHDFRPLLEDVGPAVSEADLAICHLEVPLAEEGGPFSGWPDFNAPPELAGALADTGYDACSTASNHTLDQGADGVVRTLEGLDEAGIEHAGAARSEEEANNPSVMDVQGVAVGHVSFTFGFNGHPKPDGKPWIANRLDVDDVTDAAESARSDGAEVVIASLHWGPEYTHEPSAEQRRIAEEVLDDGSVDLILGHHAHVVQPIDVIDGKWVAYGLGNHVARHAEPRGTSEEGIAAQFEFTRTSDGWDVHAAEYMPTLVDLGEPIRLIDLTSGETTERGREAIDRTEEIVLRDGADEHGLTRVER